MNKLHDDLVKLANKINLRWYMVLPIYWILLKCLYWFDIWTCLNGQVNSSTLDSIWVLSSVMCFWGLVFSVLWSRSLADKGKAHTRAGRNFHQVSQLVAPYKMRIQAVPLLMLFKSAVALWFFVSFFLAHCYIIKSKSANVFLSADASKLLNFCILFSADAMCYVI